jgi:VWFA-related protein
MGSGPTIQNMIDMQQGAEGLAELNYNVNVAFATAHDLLSQLETVTSLRKAFIWVSSGYILDPFKDARLKKLQQEYADMGLCDNSSSTDGSSSSSDPSQQNPNCPSSSSAGAGAQPATNENGVNDPFGDRTMEFKNADLMRQLDELIREANRANTIFFPIDPRGLIASLDGASMNVQLSYQEQRDFIISTTDTLKALAENTGGVGCINMNDCSKVLQQIDNMTSDYYTIGYTSSNPDPLKLRRRIEIKIDRPGVRLVPGVDYRDSYDLKKAYKKNK